VNLDSGVIDDVETTHDDPNRDVHRGLAASSPNVSAIPFSHIRRRSLHRSRSRSREWASGIFLQRGYLCRFTDAASMRLETRSHQTVRRYRVYWSRLLHLTDTAQHVLGHLVCPYFTRDTIQITSSSCTTTIPQETTPVGKQRVLVLIMG
jgi:hypothetical protein